MVQDILFGVGGALGAGVGTLGTKAIGIVGLSIKIFYFSN